MASAVPQAPAPMIAIFRLKLGTLKVTELEAQQQLAAKLQLVVARTWHLFLLHGIYMGLCISVSSRPLEHLAVDGASLRAGGRG